MSEVGPIYNVPLIDSLPLNRQEPDGMLQQMPNRFDLKGVKRYKQGQRVVAGYEVLLNHWRDQRDEIERLQAEHAEIQDEAECVFKLLAAGLVLTQWLSVEGGTNNVTLGNDDTGEQHSFYGETSGLALKCAMDWWERECRENEIAAADAAETVREDG